MFRWRELGGDGGGESLTTKDTKEHEEDLVIQNQPQIVADKNVRIKNQAANFANEHESGLKNDSRISR